MADRQLVLDLGCRPSWRADDFLVSGANRAAVTWLGRWPDWPAPALVLWGPAGCGKSHLARSFAEASGARRIAWEEVASLDPETAAEAVPAVIVEDADRRTGPPAAAAAGEAALFHLYNSLAAAGRSLLVTGRSAPPAWPTRLPDLRSRLLAVPSVAIGAPDDELLAAVLVKLFADRQIRVEDTLVGYLVSRLERSFAAARAIVERLDQASLAGRRPITRPLVHRLLAAPGGDSSGETEGSGEREGS